MPPRELSLRELDQILTIPSNKNTNEESIKSWVRDMVKFLLSISWENQKPN